MKKIILFFVLLLLPLALAATTLQTDKSNYNLNENIQISGTCDQSNTAVGLYLLFNGERIWIYQVQSVMDNSYSAQMLPPENGDYTLFSACQGDTAKTATFCVGDNCVSPAEPDTLNDGTPSSSETSSTTSGSGGSYSCTSQFSCSSWSQCNATLQQSRTCVDKKGCKPLKVEVQKCTKCIESWTCSDWSECSDYQQYRTCVDEHDCDTEEIKPQLQKDCQQTLISGPQPAKISSRINPPVIPAVTAKTTTLSLNEQLQKYGWYLGGFLLLILIILIIIVLARHNRFASNIDDLVDWMKKEKEMGVSEDQMFHTLIQTNWTPKEIDLAKQRMGYS